MASNKGIQRRGFLKTAAAATAGLMIVKPESVRGAPANSTIQIGLIGCGGRGRYVSRFVPLHTPAKLVAMADPFQDRLDRWQKEIVEKFKQPVTKDRCFAGLDGYKGVIEAGVDAVMIESPPYFHPAQAEAAIDEGKHVYIAKPLAVDVPGCKSIMESSAEAKKKGLNFLVDFQTRANELFIEAAKRVHEGQIGDLVLGHVYYHAPRLNPQADPNDKSDAARLKNWVFDKVLSGDVIVEQHIHVLDVANWYMGATPIKVTGAGGRKARTDVGDCWDHFLCIYEYPGERRVDFSSGQFMKGYSDLCIRIYGSKGTVDSHYGGPVKITGDNPWEGGATPNIYQEGAITNVKNFVQAIMNDKPINSGVEGAKSTLTAILGREAAYRETTLTWRSMMRRNRRLKARLEI